MRLEVYVRPSSSSAGVGGTHDGLLIVRVVEPAGRGRATAASLHAVADALAVPRRCVTLVRGATSRRKVFEIDLSTAQQRSTEERLALLRRQGS